MKKIVLAFLLTFLAVSPVFAYEVAPRISDREIIDKLSGLDAKIDKETANIRGDIKKLEAGQASLEKRFDDMNKRFDTLQWMFGVFTTVALVILGFVLNMQWQMQRRQAQMETTLETQKDELAFIKSLIEKLLPPRGVL